VRYSGIGVLLEDVPMPASYALSRIAACSLVTRALILIGDARWQAFLELSRMTLRRVLRASTMWTIWHFNLLRTIGEIIVERYGERKRRVFPQHDLDEMAAHIGKRVKWFAGFCSVLPTKV